MSVQILDGGDRAALYCDTDDEAFGPTFASAEHARDFLRWLAHDYMDRVRDPYTMNWFHSPDPRRYTAADLRAHHALWLGERVNELTGDLLPVEVATA